MITIALIAAATTLALFITPAVCLQLFVRHCYAGTDALEPKSDAAPLSQRCAALLAHELTPVTTSH
jgi:hypothetical protein